MEKNKKEVVVMEKLEKRWLTLDECASYVCYSPRSLYNMIHSKSKNILPFPIKHRKIAGKILFDKLEIDSFLELQ